MNTRRQARLTANVTEEQAAQGAGVSISTFRGYERPSTKIPFHRAKRLARLYRCPLTVFMRSTCRKFK